jgi:hypothetical protein
MDAVFSGEDGDKARIRERYEIFKLLVGDAGVFVPLNGSSEDRQETRAAHFYKASMHLLAFEGCGSHCNYGGRNGIRTMRGNRYVTPTTSNFRSLQWINWRAAKRLLRAGSIAVIR